MLDFKSKLQHNYSKVYRIVAVLVTLILMLLISPKVTRFQYDFEQGFPWVHQPLYAPFSFPINKTEETINAEQKEVRDNGYLYFDIAPQIKDSVLAEFNRKADALALNDSTIEKINLTQFREQGSKIIELLYSKGIIANEDSLQKKSGNFVIKTIENHVETQHELQSFYTLSQAFDSVKFWASGLQSSTLLGISILENIRPNVLYNRAVSQEILEQKLGLLSPVYGMVNKGEKIVDKGDRVTLETYQKLISLQEISVNKRGQDNSNLFIYGGTLIYLAFALAMLILIIRLFSPATYSNTNTFTLILILFYLNYALANVPRVIPEISIYALPFVLFAVVLQSFFRSSLASIIYMLMIFVSGLIASSGIEFLWIEIPAGLLAILLLKNLRKRSQLLGVIAIVFITSSLLYFASSIVKEGDLSNVESQNFLWFASSSILTILAIPLVLIIEKGFGLISEMALLELADTNNKLLRELSRKAPGTFQHSMQVANLAEECAIEIQADALLVRTGALYHDIGKMANPSYFIENQIAGHNPHNDLSPIESSKIIVKHVLDGIELAKKQKLPENIIDFIRTHHGTTFTRFFLYQAKQDDPNTDETLYQYPGPLPFSKETAILMLCDGVEAAARSLPEYTAESIQKLIDSIFNTVLESHQLDFAPITLQDISSMKKLLQKRIMNIYHVRVAYPGA